jgi:hypothetical protein
VDTGADGGNVGREWLRSNDSRLRGHDSGLVRLLGDYSWLGGLRSSDGELSSHDTEGVGLRKQKCLGEGVD